MIVRLSQTTQRKSHKGPHSDIWLHLDALLSIRSQPVSMLKCSLYRTERGSNSSGEKHSSELICSVANITMNERAASTGSVTARPSCEHSPRPEWSHLSQILWGMKLRRKHSTYVFSKCENHFKHLESSGTISNIEWAHAWCRLSQTASYRRGSCGPQAYKGGEIYAFLPLLSCTAASRTY
jgi:hypothetical protein